MGVAMRSNGRRTSTTTKRSALLAFSLLAGLPSLAHASTRAEQPTPGRGGPAPVVQVRNGLKPGSVGIRATHPTQLGPTLIVERQQDDGSFMPVRNLDLDSMRLAERCDHPPGTCITITARGLFPVPWSGMSCSSQCNLNCDRNVPLHGHFRFVVTSCDGRTRFEGGVFTL